MSSRTPSTDEHAKRNAGVAAGGLVAISVCVLLVVWFSIRAVSDVVCGSYNFISNDMCDEWNYAPPAEDALPVPPGWSIRWKTMDCGSGGCPFRAYVLEPPPSTGDGVAAYEAALEDLGWQAHSRHDIRLDDLSIALQRTTARNLEGYVPRELARDGLVFAWIGICGEGPICE